MNRCVLIAALSLPFIASIASAQGPPTPKDTAILKDFETRVSAYMKVHRAAEADVAALRKTASAKEIASRQAELAESVRAHRRFVLVGGGAELRRVSRAARHDG